MIRTIDADDRSHRGREWRPCAIPRYRALPGALRTFDLIRQGIPRRGCHADGPILPLNSETAAPWPASRPPALAGRAKGLDPADCAVVPDLRSQRRSRRPFAEAKFDLDVLDGFAFASRKLPEYMHWRLVECGRCDVP